MPSFMYPSGSFFPPAAVPPTQFTPTSGMVVVAPAGSTRLYITPAATLAALTIRLPPSPMASSSVSIVCSQIVTALTMQDAKGVAVAGAPTSLAVNTEVLMTWTGTAWIWVK
jgi:hypothetical protein